MSDGASHYSFTGQLAEGRKGEALLDAYYSRWCQIAPATAAQERAGIDRFYTVYTSGRKLSVQYKTDYMSQRTGNLVVELLSVDSANIPGWALTCTAQMLIWLRYYAREILAMQPDVLRHRLPAWQRIYKTVSIPNDGYNTIGLLVPVNEIRRICKWTGFIPNNNKA